MSNIPDDVTVDQLYMAIRDREYKEVFLDDELLLDIPTGMTHTECVLAATDYMQKRANVVLPEFFTFNAELPDVIAFTSRYSTVVECKVSRSDFLADRKKSFRINPNSGMGDLRYYCCPKGMIKPQETPYGWGLLYVDSTGKVRKQKDSVASAFTKNKDAEYHLLFYYAKRAYHAGVHNAILEYRGFDS